MAIEAVALSVRAQLTMRSRRKVGRIPVLAHGLVVSTEDYKKIGSSVGSVLRYPSPTIFCYRADVNRTMRALVGRDPPWPVGPTPLDLHFLLARPQHAS
jgi:hypothetical protein